MTGFLKTIKQPYQYFRQYWKLNKKYFLSFVERLMNEDKNKIKKRDKKLILNNSFMMVRSKEIVNKHFTKILLIKILKN